MELIQSPALRKIVRAGRRSGKTEAFAILNLENFLHGKRELYLSPITSQLDRWWALISQALSEPVKAGIYKANQTEHTIEFPGSDQRLQGKTAWDPNHIRGDYADDIVFDEFQLMKETVWTEVASPMLMDRNGSAAFGFTPRSLHSQSITNASDPRFANKLWQRYHDLMEAGNTRYFASTFTSFDNPFLSKVALNEVAADMTGASYLLEIMAQDIDEVPGALWTRKLLEDGRLHEWPKQPFNRIVVGVDPSGGLLTECGIVATGRIGREHYVLKDCSINGSPETWAQEVVKLFRGLQANLVVAEQNYGGEMVRSVLHQAAPNLPVKLIVSSRGKMLRAEPVATVFEEKRAHIVGNMPKLESEMTMWLPGDPSPNRLDALVFAMTENGLGGAIKVLNRS